MELAKRKGKKRSSPVVCPDGERPRRSRRLNPSNTHDQKHEEGTNSGNSVGPCWSALDEVSSAVGAAVAALPRVLCSLISAYVARALVAEIVWEKPFYDPAVDRGPYRAFVSLRQADDAAGPPQHDILHVHVLDLRFMERRVGTAASNDLQTWQNIVRAMKVAIRYAAKRCPAASFAIVANARHSQDSSLVLFPPATYNDDNVAAANAAIERVAVDMPSWAKSGVDESALAKTVESVRRQDAPGLHHASDLVHVLIYSGLNKSPVGFEHPSMTLYSPLNDHVRHRRIITNMWFFARAKRGAGTLDVFESTTWSYRQQRRPDTINACGRRLTHDDNDPDLLAFISRCIDRSVRSVVSDVQVHPAGHTAFDPHPLVADTYPFAAGFFLTVNPPKTTVAIDPASHATQAKPVPWFWLDCIRSIFRKTPSTALSGPSEEEEEEEEKQLWYEPVETGDALWSYGPSPRHWPPCRWISESSLVPEWKPPPLASGTHLERLDSYVDLICSAVTYQRALQAMSTASLWLYARARSLGTHIASHIFQPLQSTTSDLASHLFEQLQSTTIDQSIMAYVQKRLTRIQSAVLPLVRRSDLHEFHTHFRLLKTGCTVLSAMLSRAKLLTHGQAPVHVPPTAEFAVTYVDWRMDPSVQLNEQHSMLTFRVPLRLSPRMDAQPTADCSYGSLDYQARLCLAHLHEVKDSSCPRQLEACANTIRTEYDVHPIIRKTIADVLSRKLYSLPSSSPSPSS